MTVYLYFVARTTYRLFKQKVFQLTFSEIKVAIQYFNFLINV